MPPLDPATDFADDHGTPAWRARHTPPQITVRPTIRSAWREALRRDPMLGFWVWIIAIIGCLLLMGVAVAGFLIYALVCKLLWGQ